MKTAFLLTFIVSYQAFMLTFEIDKYGVCKIENNSCKAIGFGTYPFQGAVCEDAVSRAVQLGYSIIDTATYYDNFEAISKALSAFERNKLYIISKVMPDAHKPDGLYADLNNTLARLKISYLDAYLLHWPNSQIPIENTLFAMEKLRIQGLIHHIGLSNVTVNHLKRAMEINVPITWVQVEMHPYYYDRDLLDFCRKHSITIQAWRPLNLGGMQNDGLLKSIGSKYGKTAFQVSLRWIVQMGCIPLPGSQNNSHIQENIDIFDFTLSDEEMEIISQRASKGNRFRLKEEHGLGFRDEFDYSYEECWPKQLLERK